METMLHGAEAAHKHAQACTVTTPGAACGRDILVGSATARPEAGYLPGQLAGSWALVHSEKPPLQASHETSYTAV